MTSTLSKHALVAALATASLVVVVLGGLMLCGMLWPLSPVGAFAGSVLPITEVDQARADQSLSPARGAPNWALAERETWRELKVAPTRTVPWMRLAYIDAKRNGGRLTAAGLGDLERSYTFSPYDRDIGVWRLAFLYEHWDELNPIVRKAALEETAGLWGLPSRQAQLRQFPARISNPAGRLAVMFEIGDLEASK